MKFRDLEKVRSTIKEATGLDVSYAYDDLVFPEHAAFLIQYDDLDENNYFYYHHQDCETEAEKKIFQDLNKSFEKKDCTLVSKSAFSLNQNGEEIEIKFVEGYNGNEKTKLGNMA